MELSSLSGRYLITILLLGAISVIHCRMNVLFLVADDMRPQLGAYYGNDFPSSVHPAMYTPNLDKLAARSLLLKRAHCQQSLCSPSRTSLLTGRRPDTTHVYDLKHYWRLVGGNFKTIPQYFKENGYISAGVGKVFHRGRSASGGDDPISWSVKYFHATNFGWETNQSSWQAIPKYMLKDKPLIDTQTADYAIDMIRRLAPSARSGYKPFFIAAGFQRPHLPFVFPESILRYYPEESIRLPDNEYAPVNMPDVAWSNYQELRKYHDIHKLNLSGEINSFVPVKVVKELRRAYYCAITYIDFLIGRVINELDVQGLTNNTIISFLGDHGWQLGEHGGWTKHTNFELSTHAPMMIHIPGMTDSGVVTEHLTEFVDLFPTLVDAAGLPAMPLCPENSSAVEFCREGSSLLQLITNPGKPWKTAAFSQYPRRWPHAKVMGYTIRTATFRYTEWVKFEYEPDYKPDWNTVFGVELYDHTNNHEENHNVASHPSYSEIKQKLSKLLHAGGLFDNEEADTIENAFKYAVYRVSHDRDLHIDTKLKYDIQRLPARNTFDASKKICSQIALETVAVFGPNNRDLAAFTDSLCSTVHIPHIEYRLDSNTYPPADFTVNIHPDTDLLAKAYLDVIQHFGWTEILILYSSQEGLFKVQSLLRASNKTIDMSVIARQADLANMRAVLKEAKHNYWTHIIAELNITETEVLLKMALQEGMIDPYHHYIITNMDMELLDLEDYRHNFVNLTGFRLVKSEDEFTRKIIDDIYLYSENTQLPILNGSRLSYKCALVFDAVYLFAKAVKELQRSVILQTPNTTCDEIIPWVGGSVLYDFINAVHIQGLTGHIKLSHGKRMDFSLDIMELRDDGLRKTGSWSVGKGVNITLRRFLSPGVFGNKTLQVTTMLEAPYAMLRKETTKDGIKYTGNDRYEGFCIDLLKEMAAIIGFDYQIEVVPDGRYGVKHRNGEWDGIVKQLIDRKVDLAVAALTISYEREQYIDFTKPFLNLGISILFKVPRREKSGLFSFMNPLAIEIWIYVLAAYFVVSLTMFVLARFSPYEWYNPHPCNPETDTVENTFTLSNSLWFCVGTLMQQGSDINPRAVSTRIVGSTWWLFTLIIISSYTANLAAFLTVERMVSPITGADDLSKQTDIQYGTLEGGSTMSFFRNSTLETYQRMWNYMESRTSVFTKSVQEGIERVEAGDYAFLMESTSIEYQTERNCNLSQIGGLLDSKGYGVATPIDSPLKDKLSMAVLNLQEDGKIQMLYNKWWKSTGKCNKDDKNSKANSLGVENVGGIFVVLLAGLTLSVFTAIIEFIVKSKRNAAEDKQSLCSEMAEELRFAVRCHGSHKKPKYKTGKCPKCKKRHAGRCTHGDNRRESPNGIIAMRETRHSNMQGQDLGEYGTEYLHEPSRQFGAGGYLHVDYSDTDT